MALDVELKRGTPRTSARSRKVFGLKRAGCGVAGRNRIGSELGAGLQTQTARGGERGIETRPPHAVENPKRVGLASGVKPPGSA